MGTVIRIILLSTYYLLETVRPGHTALGQFHYEQTTRVLPVPEVLVAWSQNALV